MLHRLLLSAALLLFVLGSASAQNLNGSPCTYYGGYPWRPGGCLTAADLNAAILAAQTGQILPGSITNTMLANNYITIDSQLVHLGEAINLTDKVDVTNGASTNQALTNATINSIANPSGARTALGLGTIATQNANALNVSGVTLLTGLPNPASASDATPKSYVDAVASGLVTQAPVDWATHGVLPNSPTYSNGTAGAGATLTATTNGAIVVDTGSPNVGESILVKDQAAGLQNGPYTVTATGSPSTTYQLTRRTDWDTSAEMIKGSSFFVRQQTGATNSNSTWQLTSATPINVGVDNINFQLNFQAPVYSAGTGLNLVSQTFNLSNTGVASGLYGSATQVAQITVDNQGRITAATALNISLPASAIATGTLVVDRGGTGANLSATGGTSQVLKQTTVGGAITVARLSCADLSNGAASCSTDATNASNVTSGTLGLGVGGTGSNLTTTGGAGFVLKQTTTGAAISVAALNFTELAGTISAAQIPNTTITDAKLSGLITTAHGGTNNGTWTTGSVVFASNTTTLAENNSNLFWDNTNHRLGIGTVAPTIGTSAATAIHIKGSNGGSLRLENTAAGGLAYEFSPNLVGSGNQGFTLVDITHGINVFSTNGAATSGTINNWFSGDLSTARVDTAGSSTLCGTSGQYVPSFVGLTFCASDARLKNVVAASLQPNRTDLVIDKLIPKQFTWKSDQSAALHTHFIAQDVLPVAPECVNQNPDGYYSIDDGCILAYAVKSLQEVDARLKAGNL